MARHDIARIPASRIKKDIAALLQREGYISSVSEDEVGPGAAKTITVVLKYAGDRSCAFAGIRRVSKPGRRVYVGHGSIPRVLNGLGVSILSTSQGLMTDREARQKKVGGELICEVW